MPSAKFWGRGEANRNPRGAKSIPRLRGGFAHPTGLSLKHAGQTRSLTYSQRGLPQTLKRRDFLQKEIHLQENMTITWSAVSHRKQEILSLNS